MSKKKKSSRNVSSSSRSKAGPAKSSSPLKTKTRAAAAKKPSKKAKGKPASIKKIAPKADKNKSFPIVGIGTSAGGLEALESFFLNLTPKNGMAFVVVQHLSPHYKSAMGELLRRYTKMTVCEVTDNMKIEPNCIYLNPPNKYMGIMNNILTLIDPIENHGVRLPIDYFFRSLAQDQKDRAICIILSGTGSDGTLGLRAVKGEGGMAMVQTFQSAKYDGMPRSAVATDLVDYLLPVEKMPLELISYAKHPYIIKTVDKAEPDLAKVKGNMQKIFILLRNKFGHDFSRYKRNFMLRRIEKRLVVNQLQSMSDYVRYIQQNTNEIKSLYRDLLIGVTSFFRDSNSYEEIKTRVLPELFKNKNSKSTIRVWAIGCASGEEAYSMAIMLREYADEVKNNCKIQVFGTDVDRGSINTARAGIYPEGISTDLSSERLNRFFIKKGNTYQLKNQIREMVVFAVQNIFNDPPFSKLDLVSCRNLLIYFEPDLQNMLFPLFHYTLNESAYLFLGASESIGKHESLFSLVNNKAKIFKRKDSAPVKPINFNLQPMKYEIDASQRVEDKMFGKETGIEEFTSKLILEEYSPPCIVINENHEIVYIKGNVNPYLRVPEGKQTASILKMANNDLQMELRSGIQRAIKGKKLVTVKCLEVKNNGMVNTISLVVKPVLEPASLEGLIMIFFKPVEMSEVSPGRKSGKTGRDPSKVSELKLELRETKESLQATMQEIETSNEEFQSMNEELQSTNEELQSTVEELETSKEELQANNEELVTVNAELQNKINELYGVNNDMNNLLACIDIGTIFLDKELCIKLFTPVANKIFNIIESDIGRSISSFTPKVVYTNIFKDFAEVLHSLNRKEAEIQTKEGEWFAMRIMPYRTVENVADGIVVTFSDITERKKAADKLKRVAYEWETTFDSIKDYVSIHDNNCRIQRVNKAFADLFKMKPEELIGKHCYEVVHGTNEQIRGCSFEESIKSKKPETSDFFEPTLGIHLEVSSSPIFNQNGDVDGCVHIMKDITKNIQTENKRKKADRKVR